MLEDLAQLLPPPTGARPRRRPAWQAVEERLGTPLPEDYKALVEAYGPGCFCDFLHVLQPDCANESLDLESFARRDARAMAALADAGDAPPSGLRLDLLLPVAVTDNGDRVYWHREPGSQPQRWQIWVNEARGPQWEHHPGGLVDFLVAFVGGSEPFAAVFPDDVPVGDEATFEPYEPVATSGEDPQRGVAR